MFSFYNNTNPKLYLTPAIIKWVDNGFFRRNPCLSIFPPFLRRWIIHFIFCLPNPIQENAIRGSDVIDFSFFIGHFVSSWTSLYGVLRIWRHFMQPSLPSWFTHSAQADPSLN